jgi:hypothetical protein
MSLLQRLDYHEGLVWISFNIDAWLDYQEGLLKVH